MCQYVNYVGMVVEVCGIIEIGFTLHYSVLVLVKIGIHFAFYSTWDIQLWYNVYGQKRSHHSMLHSISK